jgi:hypothetical protein
MILQVRLREGEDDDIIAWLEQQQNKSQVIRECVRAAMVSGYSPEVLRLRTIVAEAMREALADMAVTVQPGRQPDNGREEDPELAARLDSLFDDCT